MSRIVVHNLEKNFGDVRVLERVYLSAEHGEFLSLVGSSGCGKSTFLRILLGHDQASAGVVVIGDAPIVPEPTPERGIVFQRYSVFPHLTALQNLLLVEDFRVPDEHIVIATGARPRVLKGLEPDGDRIWTDYEAMTPKRVFMNSR